MGDEDFEEADLECWLEGLEPEKYYAEWERGNNKKQLFRFRKKLPYTLEVRDFAYSMCLLIRGARVQVGQVEPIKKQLGINIPNCFFI